METTEKAYAKINLFLDVTSRRKDGFHEISTVMQTVTFADEVKVSVRGAAQTAVSVKLLGNRRLPSDGKNLAVRAATLYLDKIGGTFSVLITLNKRIPIAAGLAGGSSDAAATLRALNRLFEYPLSREQMLEIAAAIGSDVPYCLIGGTARCHGRGEVIEPLDLPPLGTAVIAIGSEHVSTPAAFGALDALFDGFRDAAPHASEEDFIRSAKAATPALFNLFEPAIFPTCPAAKALKERLLSLGAKAAALSGSGPSVYGFFENNEEAGAAKETLMREGYRAYVCHRAAHIEKI